MRTGLIAVMLAMVPAGLRAGVVYNSMTPSPGVNGILTISDLDETDSRAENPGPITSREFDAQAGDSITLAGTDRFVTEFAVRLAAFQPTNAGASADVELKIYTSAGGLAGTLLWTGVVAGVSFPTSLNGVDVKFVPNIVVPNAVVFGVALSNISNAGMRPVGIATQSSLLVGSSGPGIVVQDTASGAWRSEMYGDPFRNVQAKVTAIPGAGTASWFAVAALTGMMRRGRRAIS